jgi:FtsP/CotA-like multicopper oxidase with cupredoxin domain
VFATLEVCEFPGPPCREKSHGPGRAALFVRYVMFCLRFALPIVLAASAIVLNPETATGEESTLPPVLSNDNRRAAGLLANETLTLTLRASAGLWRPEGDAGPALRIEAFGEQGDALRIPAPLIRVREGTDVVVTLNNELPAALRVHGLCARDGAPCLPIEVPPAESREVRFSIQHAGTYHYWATTTGMPQVFRGAEDTQLSGALVVDPPYTEPDDRIFVITDWTNLTREQLQEIARADDPGAVFLGMKPKFAFPINGLSWPATERLTYRLGERVRWRVINLSTQRHPMHMHGFYFDVDSLGDGLKDTRFDDRNRRRVVTELLAAGQTMTMTWIPERVGNWLFHCHIVEHVSPDRAFSRPSTSHRDHHVGHTASTGMSGLVLGVTVVGSGETAVDASEPVLTSRSAEHGTPEPRGPNPESRAPARKLTLLMQSEPGRFGDAPAYGFALVEGDEAPEPVKISIPGPTLVLRRGEPVEIRLVNRLPEGTAIHWHGMELDSYYDGVHGWSGIGKRTTPLIEPGGEFIVRFTPPRTGTFIYHTHLHDERQLASGLYGPMLVVDPGDGEAFDPTTDHVLVIGRGGPGQNAPAILNGEREPTFVWKAGAQHRVRLVNITPDDVFVVSLQNTDGPVSWRPLTKDGAQLPPGQCAPRPAKQIIAVGETYDFEYTAPPGRQNIWIEVRSTGGKWQVQGHVIVK